MSWNGMGGGVMMIFWWVIIIVATGAVVTWIAKQNPQSGKKPSALNTLKDRYARGEISKKEFEEKKRDIA